MASPDALLASYGRQYDEIRSELGRVVQRLWRLTGGPSDENLEQWLAAVLPTVAAAERTTVTLVALYLDLLSNQWGIDLKPSISAGDIIGTQLRGVEPVDVYRRPIITVRNQLAAGKSLVEATKIGGQRAVSTAQTDVVLTHRAAAGQAFESLGFKYFRRVLTGKSCDLCQAASTQRYKTGQLLPIHPHCDCRVMPIYEQNDPGSIINSDVLATPAVQAAIADRTRRRVAQREHGELGPVLVAAAQNFTGPGDLGQ